MDGKGFFLGLIAAVVLFLLWKKEQFGGVAFGSAGLPAASSNGVSPSNTIQNGVTGCTGCGGPSAAAAPASQYVLMGPSGQISPGTPPLNNPVGGGSFYAPSGPTPDTGFFSYPAPPRLANPIFDTVRPIVAGQFSSGNVPGSPTTVATQTPVRATATVGNYAEIGGFQQRFNIVGIPRQAATQIYPA